MIPFNQKPNGMFKHTAVLMIILCISQNCLSLLEDPNRQLFKERQLLAGDRFERKSLKTSPYSRDVGADSRQSRIDSSDIRTDFREIRTELNREAARELGRNDGHRDSRQYAQVRDFQNVQPRIGLNRERTRRLTRDAERRESNKAGYQQNARQSANLNRESTRAVERVAEIGIRDSLEFHQARHSENTQSRCTRNMDPEQTRSRSTDSRRQIRARKIREREISISRALVQSSFGQRTENQESLNQRRSRLASARNIEILRYDDERTSRAFGRSGSHSRRITRNSFRTLTARGESSDRHIRDNRERTFRQSENYQKTHNARGLEINRRTIDNSNIDNRERRFVQEQQRNSRLETIRHQEESRNNLPDLARRAINQRNNRLADSANVRANRASRVTLQTKRSANMRYIEASHALPLSRRAIDRRMYSPGTVYKRFTDKDRQTRESNLRLTELRRSAIRLSEEQRVGEQTRTSRDIERLSSNIPSKINRDQAARTSMRSPSRLFDIEQVISHVRAKSEEPSIYSKARDSQINRLSLQRRTAAGPKIGISSNQDNSGEIRTERFSSEGSRSNMFNNMRDNQDVGQLPDFRVQNMPDLKGKYTNNWMNVIETVLVLALIGQAVGGTSKGKYRCLPWQGLFSKQKVL